MSDITHDPSGTPTSDRGDEPLAGATPETGASEAAYPPAAVPVSPETPPARKRTWVWVTVTLVLAAIALFSCCALMVIAVEQADGGGPAIGPAVAVIYIDAEIASGGSGVITPEDIIGQLREAANDDDVKSVLLRINSPGGTASASQEIAMEVARFDKPIVASIGDVGASGAYMIASQCDEIVASPSSDVGSIGVILQVLNASEALDKLGLEFVVITEGKYKDAGSPYRALTPEERKMLKKDMDLVYEQFIKMVAEGREMPIGEVRKLATGWAWPGERAKELGLVDTIGNYTDAVDVAAERGKIEGEPRIQTYAPDSFEQFIEELSGVRRQLQAISSLAPLEQTRPALK